MNAVQEELKNHRLTSLISRYRTHFMYRCDGCLNGQVELFFPLFREAIADVTTYAVNKTRPRSPRIEKAKTVSTASFLYFWDSDGNKLTL